MSSVRLVRNALVIVAVTFAAACHRGSTAAAGGAPKPGAKPKVEKLPAAVTVAMIAQGDSIFNTASCQRCHGKGAVGATNGPSLIKTPLDPALPTTTWDHGSGSYADIVKTIIAGVPKDSLKVKTRPFAMRARGGVQPLLTDDQVNAIAAYIWSLNHAYKK